MLKSKLEILAIKAFFPYKIVLILRIDLNYFIVPPKWIREPEDVHAVLGQDVVLGCQVEGYPKPTMLWTRANGK